MTTTVSKLQNSLKLKKGKGQNQQDRGKESGKGKDKGKKKGKGNGKKEDKKWAWKTIAPKNGETTKKFAGKLCHWCPNHVAWTLHTPEECNKGDNHSPEPSQSDASQGNNNNVSFAASVSSIMNELEDDQ